MRTIKMTILTNTPRAWRTGKGKNYTAEVIDADGNANTITLAVYNNVPAMKRGYIVNATGNIGKHTGDDGRIWTTLWAKHVEYIGMNNELAAEETTFSGFPQDNTPSSNDGADDIF